MLDTNHAYSDSNSKIRSLNTRLLGVFRANEYSDSPNPTVALRTLAYKWKKGLLEAWSASEFSGRACSVHVRVRVQILIWISDLDDTLVYEKNADLTKLYFSYCVSQSFFMEAISTSFYSHFKYYGCDVMNLGFLLELIDIISYIIYNPHLLMICSEP